MTFGLCFLYAVTFSVFSVHFTEKLANFSVNMLSSEQMSNNCKISTNFSSIFFVFNFLEKQFHILAGLFAEIFKARFF